MDYKALINKPKTKRGRETLNNILSAAAQEIYEKGYHNAGINDITRRAGVASGTFYVYFDSKDDLYKFLLLQCSHMIRKHQTEAIKNCKTRREAEEVGLREWLRFVQKNPYMYHIIWESLYVDKQLFVDYYTTFSQAYVKGLEYAKERGEIRPEIDSEVLAWLLMGATNFLGLNWGLFKDRPSEMDNVVKNYMRILNGGVFTDAPSSEPGGSDAPIRIEVEFDDDEELEADEDENPAMSSADEAVPSEEQAEE